MKRNLLVSKIILSLSILLTWIISASAQEITAEVYQSSTASAGNVVKIVKDEEKTVPKYEETK